MNIKEIFGQAFEKKASDVHLVVGLLPILRINGKLSPLKKYNPIDAKELEQAVTSLLTAGQSKTFKEKKDFDFAYSLAKDKRFRINLHFEKGNIGLVGRVIKPVLPTMEELRMPEATYRLLEKKQGLVLVTGPTGCGKSTTLAAMINNINENRGETIITLEDPIEFIFKSKKSAVIQRELGIDMNDFASGLKHCLRQDPNVIMVGEMRDLETISTALTLAETGHLVFATLHTYSAAQTIDRIIDIFPPHQQSQIKAQISTTLISVISQRLLPAADDTRVAAREILFNTPAVANLIREGKIAQIRTVIETNSKEGMVSLNQDLKRLYKENLIDEEVLKSYSNL